jgi:L-amino acid N-acyltransferase YncA/DNA-binding transcriptional ArsR family regulator
MIATIDAGRYRDPVTATVTATETASSAPAPATVAPVLGAQDAATYAAWFATLADPTRVRLLHAVATAPTGTVRVGDLAEQLGTSQSTASHHVRRLAEVGFLLTEKVGTTTRVRVNAACCTGLPHAADVVMGTLASVPCCPADLPDDVTVRAVQDDDLPRVLEVYAEGIATGDATFETSVPQAGTMRQRWLPGHAWVAEVDGEVVGWTALSPTSSRECYAGVAEGAVYVAERARGRGVGRALLHRQVTEADAAGLWTLQASVFPENRASLAVHRSAGYRTLAVRSRIARLDGRWRDTVLLERRSPGC